MRSTLPAIVAEVVGQIIDDVVQTCDEHGNRLTGDQRPVSAPSTNQGRSSAQLFTCVRRAIGSQKSKYSNWELSSDRANSARRLMQHPNGLRADQVKQVRGFADQRLRNAKDAFDASNRRISIIVQNLTTKSEAPEELRQIPRQSAGKRKGLARESTPRQDNKKG